MGTDSMTTRRVATGVAIALLVVLDIALIFLYFQKDDNAAPSPTASSSSPASSPDSSPTVSSTPHTSPPSSSDPASSSPRSSSPDSTTPPSSSPTPTHPSSTVTTPPSSSQPPTQPKSELTVVAPQGPARPFKTVRLSGHFVKSHSLLQVQQRQGNRWITFPLPTMTDGSGRYTAYVELAKRGRHQLRVVSEATGADSNVVTVTVR